jgi:hypothetical protein
VGAIDVETRVVRAAVGWVVTARAGGAAIVEATLAPRDGHPPALAVWQRLR